MVSKVLEVLNNYEKPLFHLPRGGWHAPTGAMAPLSHPWRHPWAEYMNNQVETDIRLELITFSLPICAHK